MNKVLRRILKILGWTVVSIIILIILVIVLIQVPGVQDFGRKKIVSFLEHKLGTRVRIGHLSVAFPKKIVLEDIYFEDQKHDTLIAGSKLAVDISMLRLLDKKVEVNDIELEGIRAKISRLQPDTAFNFDYIINAFTGKKTSTTNPADTNGFKMNVKHVKLSRILATFKDDQSGSDTYFYLGDFETNIKKFDIDHYVFDVPDMRIGNIIARVYQHKPLVEPKSMAEVEANNTQPIKLDLTLGKLLLKDIDADYGNDVSAVSATLQLGELVVIPEKIDLQKLDIHLKNLTLNNTSSVITLGNTPQAHVVEDQANKTATVQASNPWKIFLDKVTFTNNHLKFDNNNRPKAPKGMDFAHLDVSSLNLDANKLSFTPSALSGDVNKLAFNEQCGFHLLQLHTSFLYDDHGAYLRDLLLQTDKTLVRREIGMSWPSLAMISNHMGDMLVNADLRQSTLAFADVLTFAPTLATVPPFFHNENAVFRLDAQVKGYVRDLEIANLELSGMQHTALKISGRVKGLPNPAKTLYNLNIANFSTTQADLKKLLPAAAMPPSVRLPETIAAQGAFVGSMNDFNTKLRVHTSRGNADIAAVIRGMGKSYHMNVAAGSLDLGYILKQEKNMGKISAVIEAQGGGFDPKTMAATVKARVTEAQAMGYDYHNFDISAKLNHGNITTTATMRDPNLAFSLNADAVMKGAYPALKMDLMLDSANLQALHLYKDQLRTHGHILADLPSTNPDALLGQVRITDLIVANNGKRYAATDTIDIDAFEENGGRHIRLASEALTADLTGQYKLTELATAVQSTINKYYQIPGFRAQPFAPQQWVLTAAIKPSPLLYTFVPEMKGSDTIHADIHFNSAANDFSLAARAPKILYSGNLIDSLNISANTAAALNYAVTVNGIRNPQLRLNHTALTGSVANNQLTTNLDVKDANDKSQYQLAALLNQVANNGYKINLQPGLMLNYTTWNVAGDNYIQYDDNGLVIHNFNLSNGAQSISANSTAPVASAPIDVRFTNFRINTITQIAGQDSTLADGLVNGTAQVKNPVKDPIFTSDITIADLSYKRDTVGNLTVKVNNETSQTLAANIQLQGHGNDLRLDGRYFIPDKRVDMNLNLVNINLATLKPFSGGQLTDASGNLKGELAIKGTMAQPSVNGAIRFDSAYVTPTMLGERFALTNDDINLNATGIHFNGFSLADSANNKAVIDGDILTKDYKDYQFALNVSADNFRAVHSKRGSVHQPFYGNLNLSTNTKIRGTMNIPVINSYLRINQGTDFNYVLPVNDPEVQSRVGVVQFVDMRRQDEGSVFGGSDSVSNKVDVTGMDASATIETDSSARFTIIIDERNGDAIHIRGTAALQAGVDKSGKVSLTGTYTMQEGSYLMTLNFLKRQFSIKPGSTITWDGDPTTATVDITAIYLANTAPIDLVQHQISGRSIAEINQYKQRLPFNVLLKMKGELLKPVISFDIILPEREASRWKEVTAKLDQVRADESELNKQVFALLLLNRFVDENPLESNGTPSTAESFVRQSASRILTDQLNRLAGNLIHGVDLNFGVNSGTDYSSEGMEARTDVTVGVSKRLLNDRLRVNVGSSFEVEGPSSSGQQASNIAGDVSVDYQLSKDGRYLVRAYRRNDYEGIVEGQVIETGATFIFTLEYDKFSEFFRKKKKDGSAN